MQTFYTIYNGSREFGAEIQIVAETKIGTLENLFRGLWPTAEKIVWNIAGHILISDSQGKILGSLMKK